MNAAETTVPRDHVLLASTTGSDGRTTERYLQTLDAIGGLLAAFMTLEPLAATALFAH